MNNFKSVEEHNKRYQQPKKQHLFYAWLQIKHCVVRLKKKNLK